MFKNFVQNQSFLNILFRLVAVQNSINKSLRFFTLPQYGSKFYEFIFMNFALLRGADNF